MPTFCIIHTFLQSLLTPGRWSTHHKTLSNVTRYSEIQMILVPLVPKVCYFNHFSRLLLLPSADVKAASELMWAIGPTSHSRCSQHPSLPIHSPSCPFSLKSLSFTSFPISTLCLSVILFIRQIFNTVRVQPSEYYMSSRARSASAPKDTGPIHHVKPPLLSLNPPEGLLPGYLSCQGSEQCMGFSALLPLLFRWLFLVPLTASGILSDFHRPDISDLWYLTGP